MFKLRHSLRTRWKNGFNKFSCGAELLITRVDGKDCGCIINTASPSCTSGYYHARVKPGKNPAPEQKERWVCQVCGYAYEGAEMPDDFTCPLRKHGKEAFEHVVLDLKPKQKGDGC